MMEGNKVHRLVVGVTTTHVHLTASSLAHARLKKVYIVFETHNKELIIMIKCSGTHNERNTQALLGRA